MRFSHSGNAGSARFRERLRNFSWGGGGILKRKKFVNLKVAKNNGEVRLQKHSSG